MEKKRLVIQKTLQKKSEFVIKSFINDSRKLKYFFDKFIEFQNYSNGNRYPSIEKWREYIVTELLENITEDKFSNFDIFDFDNLTSTEDLIKKICKWQINRINVFNYGINLITNFYKINNISINFGSMYFSFEIIEDAFKDIISWNQEGLNNLNISFSKCIENNLKSENNQRLIFEGNEYHELNFKNSLYDLLKSIESGTYQFYGLDKILFCIGHTISFEDIDINFDNIEKFINNEYESSESFNNSNIISKKYNEISQMFLQLFSTKEKDLLRLRYGIKGNRRYTLKEIYIIKNYHHYENLIIDLTRILWKLKITWPADIICKILYGKHDHNSLDSHYRYQNYIDL